jgi:hypothetical protein
VEVHAILLDSIINSSLELLPQELDYPLKLFRELFEIVVVPPD